MGVRNVENGGGRAFSFLLFVRFACDVIYFAKKSIMSSNLFSFFPVSKKKGGAGMLVWIDVPALYRA